VKQYARNTRKNKTTINDNKPQLRREKQNLSNLKHDAKAISFKNLDNLCHEELEGVRKIIKKRNTNSSMIQKPLQKQKWNKKR